MVAPGAGAARRLALRARRVTMSAAVRQGPWLVLAPHPDDESLGVGSLLAGIVAGGGRVSVAFLTDGAGSHRDAPGWSPARIAWTRAAEARAALRCLGLTEPPLLLGWRDGDPYAGDDRGFAQSLRAIVAWARRRGVRSIAVTWRREPHCDHEAAARLAAATAKRLGATLHQYLVWGWTMPHVDTLLRRARTSAVDVARGRPAQRRAIARHRSQTGTRIGGGPQAFRLPEAMIALAARPRLILVSERTCHAP